MAAVTLTTLRARARARADKVGSAFISDSELDQWLNEGVQELHDLLTNSFQDYSVSTATFNTVAGQSDYALATIAPAGLLKLRALDATINGRYRTVRRYNVQDRNKYRLVGQLFGRLACPRYALQGTNLSLLPPPSAVHAMTITYTPEAALLVNGTDAVNFPNGWEQFVVLHAAACCLEKEESDSRVLRGLQENLRARIEQNAADRDSGQPAQAVDIETVDSDDYWDGPW